MDRTVIAVTITAIVKTTLAMTRAGFPSFWVRASAGVILPISAYLCRDHRFSAFTKRVTFEIEVLRTYIATARSSSLEPGAAQGFQKASMGNAAGLVAGVIPSVDAEYQVDRVRFSIMSGAHTLNSKCAARQIGNA